MKYQSKPDSITTSGGYAGTSFNGTGCLPARTVTTSVQGKFQGSNREQELFCPQTQFYGNKNLANGIYLYLVYPNQQKMDQYNLRLLSINVVHNLLAESIKELSTAKKKNDEADIRDKEIQVNCIKQYLISLRSQFRPGLP